MARPKPFRFGKLPDSIYVYAKEIGNLGANLEVILRKTRIRIPSLPIPKELQQSCPV
jgi:hypothetical protein